VLRFLENRHHEPGEVGTSATCNDAVAEDTARSKLVSVINTRQNNSRYIRGHLRKGTNEVSRRPIQISAEFAQRHSVDDGYWTLLLEQVRGACCPPVDSLLI
jgi:hypothetical protein